MSVITLNLGTNGSLAAHPELLASPFLVPKTQLPVIEMGNAPHRHFAATWRLAVPVLRNQPHSTFLLFGAKTWMVGVEEAVRAAWAQRTLKE